MNKNITFFFFIHMIIYRILLPYTFYLVMGITYEIDNLTVTSSHIDNISECHEHSLLSELELVLLQEVIKFLSHLGPWIQATPHEEPLEGQIFIILRQSIFINIPFSIKIFLSNLSYPNDKQFRKASVYSLDVNTIILRLKVL